MKRNAKNTAKPTTSTPETTATPKPEAPKLTLATIELMRSADHLDAAVRVLAPASRATADAIYTLNATCAEPLPARRGVCLRVVAAAARLNGPFKVADITAALPDVKGAKYWVGKLAKTGHLTAVTE